MDLEDTVQFTTAREWEGVGRGVIRDPVSREVITELRCKQ